MSRALSRNEIIAEAAEIERRCECLGIYGLAGEAQRLSNDACEAQHTLRSLRRRLSMLRRIAPKKT